MIAAPDGFAMSLADDLFIARMSRALRHLSRTLIESPWQRADAYARAFAAKDDARLARLDRRALVVARLDPLRGRCCERSAA